MLFTALIVSLGYLWLKLCHARDCCADSLGVLLAYHEEVISFEEGFIWFKLWFSFPGIKARTASFTDNKMKG